MPGGRSLGTQEITADGGNWERLRDLERDRERQREMGVAWSNKVAGEEGDRWGRREVTGQGQNRRGGGIKKTETERDRARARDGGRQRGGQSPE